MRNPCKDCIYYHHMARTGIAYTSRQKRKMISASMEKGETHDTLAMGARGVYPRRLAWRLDNGRHYRREPRR